MNIVKVVFGSHLYGTSDESSDHDFKGVFMPTRKQIYLGKIPNSVSNNSKKNTRTKNTSEDVDIETYSLHYFLHLACEGETVALDMLHAPDEMLIETSHIWKRIVAERHRFYTKNLKSFGGYARRQAAKYGIKGSRLDAAKRVSEFLKGFDQNVQMFDIWDKLPMPEHCSKSRNKATGEEEYDVCGKRIQKTTRVRYALPIVETFHKNYGARAKAAAQNKGIDWKALSHALRAAFQVKQILTQKTITFPLEDAPYLLAVKQGQLDYRSEVAPRLEDLMEEVEQLTLTSDLPASVDRKYWDDFIIKVIGEQY
jgi:predicted nucleotidyltransferase